VRSQRQLDFVVIFRQSGGERMVRNRCASPLILTISKQFQPKQPLPITAREVITRKFALANTKKTGPGGPNATEASLPFPFRCKEPYSMGSSVLLLRIDLKLSIGSNLLDSSSKYQCSQPLQGLPFIICLPA
jgi:hypothetical protein